MYIDLSIHALYVAYVIMLVWKIKPTVKSSASDDIPKILS